jgi:CRP-like cAMP-binding protein
MSKNVSPIEVEVLKRFSLFNGLNEGELEQIASLVSIRKVKNGEVIAREGDPGDELFILLEGELQVSRKLTLLASEQKEADKMNKMLIRLKAEQYPFVGEMSLFEEGLARSATLVALGNVKLGVINDLELLKLTQSNLHLGYCLFFNIGKVLTERLNKANQDILKLTTAFSLALERR